ncbi:hypothetical protein A2533_01845 [Candidatus Falkowbacteria bacterium RIFOXYD2_FULL_35_9]|uniref:ATP-dependent RNA helicase n=1 Tax=Candidatus Falkowbacteria bacterium RIFOXYC2_FULL_36_12 TaxID=1798002 RepID=A0A1F5SYI7_9BACT|nr:MAG: hypothetical protein A2478_04875 [Candidatus Falkowbacteria bacterium RIFOXYC2_FULL_36_12]OGF33802.1 MAG: hypothetical protein A2223_00315 [Candidatus Falkowbacteria bacterium RIFOXYA2_FULL_35_8]OGF48247.1 MAG: hypothetical protein A2533_01845 [Candidatus Falkowbacteria bacterium RIFOXYD2_FULL_35_9]
MSRYPITNWQDQIIKTVTENPVTVIVGPTGSGKSTQLAQFFVNFGKLDESKAIAVLEPRRLVTRSLATFVNEEMNLTLGCEVGYENRFDKHRDLVHEKIVFMTTGILLQEMMSQNNLVQYSLIIVDEAHERSVDVDIVMFVLKQILKQRPDLRVIIASATIDHEKFATYYDNAPVIQVEGKMFPVEVKYCSKEIKNDTRNDDGEPGYIMVLAKTVEFICNHENVFGDILVFLPGLAEIRMAETAILNLKLNEELEIYPLYASMKYEEQKEALTPNENRRVILATNVAETGLTVEGVVYVINSGLVKQNDINPSTKTSVLHNVENSQSSCRQREGRAGRTQPGKCFNLFTKENFEQRPAFTKPEIQRTYLENPVLTLLSLGYTNPNEWDLIDMPLKREVDEAMQTLRDIDAIDKDNNLTKKGVGFAKLTIHPRLAQLTVGGIVFGCSEEMITIVAFLSAYGHLYYTPTDTDKQVEKELRRKAQIAWSSIQDPISDFMTYLKIWDIYTEIKSEGDGITPGQWAYNHFLNNKYLQEVWKIRRQLVKMLNSLGAPSTSSRNPVLIHKSVLAGFYNNLMTRGRGYEYRHKTAGNVYRTPGTVCFQSDEPNLVAVGIGKRGKKDPIYGQKTYMDHVAPVKPEWLLEVAKRFVVLEIPQYAVISIDENARCFTLSGLIKIRKNNYPQDSYYYDSGIIAVIQVKLPEVPKDDLPSEFNLVVKAKESLISYTTTKLTTVEIWSRRRQAEQLVNQLNVTVESLTNMNESRKLFDELDKMIDEVKTPVERKPIVQTTFQDDTAPLRNSPFASLLKK